MNKEMLKEFLETNKNRKIKEIQVELLSLIDELTVVTRLGRTYLVDKNNKVFAIFCYYHKQFELLSEVEYGQKVSSSTGYNTMCKVGVRAWTRQQKLLKELGSEIVNKIENGFLTREEIQVYKETRTNEIKQIDVKDKPVGYSTKEETEEKYYNQQVVEVTTE